MYVLVYSMSRPSFLFTASNSELKWLRLAKGGTGTQKHDNTCFSGNVKVIFLIYIYITRLCVFVCPCVCRVLFVPRRTNISDTLDWRGGRQTFFTHRGGQTCLHRGGQTFYVAGLGGYNDVDEQMDVSEAKRWM